MRRFMTTAIGALTMALALAAPAMAHEGGGGGGGPVAPADAPNCFGARTSHAASRHGLNPKAKAANIQWWIDETDFFDDLLVPWYGETVEVREVQAWVRMMCGTGPG